MHSWRLFGVGVLVVARGLAAFAQTPDEDDLAPLTQIDRNQVGGMPASVAFTAELKKQGKWKIPFSHQVLVDGKILLEKNAAFAKLKDQQVRCLFTLKGGVKLSDQTSTAALERPLNGESFQIAAARVSIESLGRAKEAVFASFQINGDALVEKISCAKVGTQGSVSFSRRDFLRGVFGRGEDPPLSIRSVAPALQTAPTASTVEAEKGIEKQPQPLSSPPSLAPSSEDAGILEGLE